MAIKDLTGQRFGKLCVISRAPSGPRWQTRWNCVCDCGTEKIVLASNLTTGKSKSCGCGAEENRRRCNKKAMLSEAEVYEQSDKNGFIYLGGFKGVNKPALFRCQECEHRFQMQAQHAVYGMSRCPKCRNRTHGSSLSDKFFENYPQLKEAPCNVYLLKLKSDSEEFWKIGVTRRPLKQRIRQLPYEVVEQEFVETTLWRGYLLEKQLKQSIQNYRYTPQVDFCGWTECFQPHM